MTQTVRDQDPTGCNWTHRGDGPSGGLPGCLRGVRGRCTTPGKARTPGFDPACNLSRAFPPYRTSLCPEDEAHHRGDCAENISKPDFHSVTGGCPECDTGGKRDSPVWMYFAMKLKRSRMISSPAEMCGVQRDWLLKISQYINYFGRVGPPSVLSIWADWALHHGTETVSFQPIRCSSWL